jgi:hypothetical protein
MKNWGWPRKKRLYPFVFIPALTWFIKKTSREPQLWNPSPGKVGNMPQQRRPLKMLSVDTSRFILWNTMECLLEWREFLNEFVHHIPLITNGARAGLPVPACSDVRITCLLNAASWWFIQSTAFGWKCGLPRAIHWILAQHLFGSDAVTSDLCDITLQPTYRT